MTNNDSPKNKREIILIVILALVAMTLVTVAVIPPLRNRIKASFILSDRDVIAKVSGSLSSKGPQITVLKIKNKNTINIEVFAVDEDEGLSLMTKLPLYETRDGHFLLQGNATNLALTDVDKDGVLEIVAPTYDEQMVPRLNIFKYNLDSNSFDRMTAPVDFNP